MTPNQKADLAFYQAEARQHLFAGRKREALGCYILGRDLAGIKVDEQTRRDYAILLQAEQAGR